MSKDEISYQILYRYSLEKLYSTLTRRVDNLLSFALVFLGVGVTINVGSPFILGPGIVGIAILKRVLRFGTRSAQADRQSRAWLKLFNTQHRFLSDKTLFLAFTSLEQDASEAWSMLIGPAIVMTETALGKTSTAFFQIKHCSLPSHRLSKTRAKHGPCLLVLPSS
ncbi:hypothetical protein [Salmonella enterica]|uniref:hypothetical protein n=1 Tax=Salmonella enterica TaxID=28901 RepID=UPI003735D036